MIIIFIIALILSMSSLVALLIFAVIMCYNPSQMSVAAQLRLLGVCRMVFLIAGTTACLALFGIIACH